MSKSTGTKAAPKSGASRRAAPVPRTPSTPTRPVTAPAPRRAPGAPVQHPVPEQRTRTSDPNLADRSGPIANANANGSNGTAPVKGNATPLNHNGPDNANADITSESNFNQGKTPAEHRSEQQAATAEAEQQLREHPQGLPLPTSGQPLTKPEPDAVSER